MGKNKNNRDYYVYGYLRLDTNTYFYIGQGKGQRSDNISARSKEFKDIINNCECCMEIIKDNLTEEESLKLEHELMEDLVFNEGYSINVEDYCDKNESSHLVNKGFGGRGNIGHKAWNHGKQLSEDHRRKISKSEKGKHLTEEHKKKISEANKGENNPMFGKHLSEEHRRKIGDANRGENNPMFGKPKSDETKQKISRSRTGKCVGVDNPMYGRKMSDETKEKMRRNNKQCKPIYCVELNMEFSGMAYAVRFIKNKYGILFNRGILRNRLAKNDIAEYGKIELNGKVITLHWKYI